MEMWYWACLHAVKVSWWSSGLDACPECERLGFNSPLRQSFNPLWHWWKCVLFEFFTICISVRLSDRSLHREEQKNNLSKIAPSGVWNQDLQIISLMLYQLSLGNIQLPAWIFLAFIKLCSTDSRNAQSPTCELVHETNKAHFRNLLSNRFLPSSVGKALA